MLRRILIILKSSDVNKDDMYLKNEGIKPPYAIFYIIELLILISSSVSMKN